MFEIAQFDGRVLRAKREQVRKTQAEIAEMLGITPQSYGEMERSQIAPTAANLTKMCLVFSVSPEEFFPLLKKKFAKCKVVP